MTTLRRRTNSEREPDFSSLNFDHKKNFTYQVRTPQAFLSSDMTCRDRTAEFISVIQNKEFKSRDRRKENGHSQKIIPHKEHLHNFMLIAKQIGKDISSTFSKLEKLTLLAKKRSLFTENSVEIQELTYIIKQDISSLNQQISELQEMSKSRHHSQGKHMRSHTKSVVLSLQTKLASMSSDFKSVLEVRTENLKQEKDRRERFSSQTPMSLPASATSSGINTLLNDEREAQNRYNQVSIDMDGRSSHGYQQQIELIDEQDTYLQSRADAMQNIESTIVELSSIFQNLAFLVKEQEEIVQRIDGNVEEAQLNVEAAHSEILRYFQSVSSNRWLMIKIFAVLIAFFILFIVFIA